MATLFTDLEAKAEVQRECDKRNRHKSKFMTEREWKPIWESTKGWKPHFGWVGKQLNQKEKA